MSIIISQVQKRGLLVHVVTHIYISSSWS